MLVRLLLAGRARARIAAHAAQLEGVVIGVANFLLAGAGARELVSLGLIGESDPAPFFGPVIAIEALQGFGHLFRIGVMDVIEGAEMLFGTAQHLLPDLI